MTSDQGAVSAPVIEVTAPSRLHFGMFSFGQASESVRQFGGVGAMVSQPGVQLRFESAERFAARGALAGRVTGVIERVARGLGLVALPKCRVEITSSPPEHVGLGTGTQVSLAATAGLNAFLGGQPFEATQLAALAGRASRSAIGTHGFSRGGLLVESGKLAGEGVSPLESRVELPSAWRFVLLLPRDVQRGLSGEAESWAFRDLPPVPPETTARLRQEVDSELLPAARTGDFARFGESLYRFGRTAGLCFAARQGGPFASPQICDLVRAIRGQGIRGVGQTSWGPTVFALLESAEAAEHFANSLGQQIAPDYHALISQPANSGAHIIRRA